MGSAVRLSVVVAGFQEEATVPRFVQALVRELERHGLVADTELVFVDDGSADATYEVAWAAARRQGLAITALRLTRNGGTHAAWLEGARHARGARLAFIACDLQEPVWLVPRLLAESETTGAQVVWAVRRSRADARGAVLLARAYYALLRRLGVRVPSSGASALLLGPRARRIMTGLPERNLTIECAVSSLGFPAAEVAYDRGPRLAGRSKWTLAKKLKLFTDGVIGYSYAPIRLSSLLGVAACLGGLAYAAFLVAQKLLQPGAVIPGWTALMVVLLLLSGAQMLLLGIAGEYIWRILDEVRGRPRTVVADLRRSDPIAARRGRLGSTASRQRGGDDA